MTEKCLLTNLAAASVLAVGAIVVSFPILPAVAQTTNDIDAAFELGDFAGPINDQTQARVLKLSCDATDDQLAFASGGIVKGFINYQESPDPPREGFWSGRLERDGRCLGFDDQRVRAEVRGNWTEIEIAGYRGANHVFEAELTPKGIAKASHRLRQEYVGVHGQFNDDEFDGFFYVTPSCRAKIKMEWARRDQPFIPDFEGRFNGRWSANAPQCGGEVDLFSRRGRLTGRLGDERGLLGEIRRNGEIVASGEYVSIRGQIFPGGAAGELQFDRGSCSMRVALSPQFGMFAGRPTVIKSLEGGKSPERVPLIVVPGILGSTLVDVNDPQKLVWGDLEQTLEDFSQLTLERPRSKARLKPKDILRDLSVVSIAGTRKFYGHLLERLTELGYREGRDLFAFYYDWRRSNFFTAERLHEFIAENRLAGREIDIVAHSMGGIVARLYLDRYAETQRVRKLVAMAVPHYGSMQAISVLFEGTDPLGLPTSLIVGAGDTHKVLRVIWSFESIYELLPTYGNCCFVRLGNYLEPFDPADPLAWQDYSWLIPEPVRDDHTLSVMKRSLNQLQRIRTVMSKEPPANVEFHALVNGELWDTETQVALHWDSLGRHEPLCGGGDGTVPALSQYNDIPADRFIHSPREHSAIFNDDRVWLRLGEILAR